MEEDELDWGLEWGDFGPDDEEVHWEFDTAELASEQDCNYPFGFVQRGGCCHHDHKHTLRRVEGIEKKEETTLVGSTVCYASILKDKLINSLSRSRLDFLQRIHPAEITPLALSMGIVVQGFVFIGIQATGLKAVVVGNCKTISQILWPGT